MDKEIKLKVKAKQKRKSNAGRPTAMTSQVLDKLCIAFSLGLTDEKACFFAGIADDTLYKYQRDNPQYLKEKQSLKNKPVLKAKETMFSLMDSSDEKIKFSASKDVLDRYEGKARERIELSGGDKPIQVEIVTPEVTELLNQLQGREDVDLPAK